MGKDDKPDFFDSCSEYEPTDDESSSRTETEQETSSEEGTVTPVKRQLPDEELGDDTEEEYDEEPSVSNIIKLLDLAAGEAIKQREIPVSFLPTLSRIQEDKTRKRKGG